MANKASIIIERGFKVPAEKIFDAWLSTDLIGQWMFGPGVRDETIIGLTNDAIAGGAFSFKVQRDGEVINHTGTYLTIEKPHQLSFTWGIAGLTEEESVVLIHIAETTDGCTLSLTHEGVWDEYAGRTETGWHFMMDKLDTVMTDPQAKVYVEAQMMIRKPASVVFEAFINPEITRHFWFTKGSAPLEIGKTVVWEWEMYGVSTPVLVKEIIPDQQIVINWGEPATLVVFSFQSLSEATTYVIISQYGLQGSGDALLAQVKEFTGGFTTVLDGLKAYLEHGINLHLMADKFPKAAGDHGNL